MTSDAPGRPGPVPDSLAARLESVRSDIAAAAGEAERRPDELTTVVVTKFQPASLVHELFDLGVRDFGESRHQEARSKHRELSHLDLTWHFVGQLQSNKARQAAEYVRVIHSLDRDSVVDALAADDRDRPLIDAFIQVNLTDDPARGGVQETDVERMAERIGTAAGLSLVGVMAVAPLDEEPRRAFARLRSISERLASVDPAATAISAGMSGDFREAILEGATHLRIGTAITGMRPERR